MEDQREMPAALGRRSGIWPIIAVVAAIALVATSVVAVTQLRDHGADRGTTNAGLSQQIEGGNVTVRVTWRGSGAGPIFDIAMDTHSVDLDAIDLGQTAILRVGGNEYAPVQWDAEKGGHHRSGILAFPATDAAGQSLVGSGAFELVIRDVAGVAERVFEWNP